MVTVALILLGLAGTYLAIVTAYLFAIMLGAWRYRGPSHEADSAASVIVVVPAHNEQHQIGQTVTSLLGQRYARDRLRCVVIADNCEDDTAGTARRAGADVLERAAPDARGKGQAIDWALREHRPSFDGVDVIALVDADMEVDPGFIAAISAAFQDPDIHVLQSLYRIANPEASWRAALGFASFTVINHVRPAGRCWIGGTAELKGSGMAFRSGFLLDRGWSAHGLVEDMEFGKQLLIEGVRVIYAPHAVVKSPLPVRTRQALVQQSRWERGRMLATAGYLPRFVREWLRRPSLALTDGVLDLLVPPMSVLLLFICGFAILAAWVYPAALPLAILFLIAPAACIATGLIQLRAPPKVWAWLAAAPAFALWKTGLVAWLALRGSEMPWRRTPRDAEIGKH